MYFDNFEGSVVRRDPNRRHDWRPTAWIYAHFPLAACLAVVGDGMAHLIGDDAHVERKLVVMCGVALAGVLLTMALILVSTAGGVAASRRRRATARVLGAALIVAIAMWGGGLALPLYFAALGGVLVFQVVFDVVDGVRVQNDGTVQAS